MREDLPETGERVTRTTRSSGRNARWTRLSLISRVLLLFILLQAACPAAAANVAVLISADVEAYKEALKGFKEGVHHRIAAEYAMDGDLSAGRKALTDLQSKAPPDLILAVGVWALQVIAEQPTEIPVVYAMVLNPLSVIGEGRKNITGASMNVPVKATLELIKKLGPQIHRIGVVFNHAKTGYLIKRAEATAREEGLQLVAQPIGSPREAIAALDALQESGIDALWIAPDETILVPEVIQHMLLLSYNQKIPVIGLSQEQAQQGAVLSLQFASSEDIGKQAAELANGILDGQPVSELPYTAVRQVSVTVNLKAAQKLGVTIPASILGVATTIIQ